MATTSGEDVDQVSGHWPLWPPRMGYPLPFDGGSGVLMGYLVCVFQEIPAQIEGVPLSVYL